MTQNYYFSPTTLGFYPVSMKESYISAGTFPSDAVLVEDTVFSTYSGNPPTGKKRGVSSGSPAWVTE